MVNKVILVGYLGKDPELRQTSGGSSVANFSMATSEHWRDGASGEKKERTEWHRIVAWGKSAEFCANYLTKGRLVYVEGRIQTREWDDKEGNRQRTTEIVASNVTALGKGNDQPQQGGGSALDRIRSRLDQSNVVAERDREDNDIPF